LTKICRRIPYYLNVVDFIPAVTLCLCETAAPSHRGKATQQFLQENIDEVP